MLRKIITKSRCWVLGRWRGAMWKMKGRGAPDTIRTSLKEQKESLEDIRPPLMEVEVSLETLLVSLEDAGSSLKSQKVSLEDL
jgi:hypothetical protein